MIVREDQGDVAVVRMAHGKASAMDVELLEELESAFAEIETTQKRAVVLTGTGSIFSAGVDLFRIVDGGTPYIGRFLPLLSRAIEKLFALPMPVVAAINGHAIAGGCVLAFACDYRVMNREKGTIGLPELLVGVPFPSLVLEIARLVVPPQHFPNVVLRGKTFSAADALQIGIVNESVGADDVLPHAVEIARELAAVPAEAFALAKRQMHRQATEAMRTFAPQHDAEVLRVWCGPSSTSAIKAYLARTLGK